MVSGFGRSLSFGSSFDSYIPKPKTFGNASGGFDTHVYHPLKSHTSIDFVIFAWNVFLKDHL